MFHVKQLNRQEIDGIHHGQQVVIRSNFPRLPAHKDLHLRFLGEVNFLRKQEHLVSKERGDDFAKCCPMADRHHVRAIGV